MTMTFPCEDERDFLGPWRPTWTDFERFWYLRDLAKSSKERRETLERGPVSKADTILLEDAFLESLRKTLEKLSKRISLF